MKKILPMLLVLALCASLMVGCSERPVEETPEPAGNEAPMTGLIVEQDEKPMSVKTEEVATELPPAQPTEAPAEPEIELDAAIASGMQVILDDINMNYHFGVAGSSLTAARLASELMDWSMGYGEAYTRFAARTYTPAQTTEGDAPLQDKLMMLYSNGAAMTGYYGKALLESAGVQPVHWPFPMTDVRTAFDAVMEAMGMSKTTMLRVYSGDDNGEHFRAWGVEVQAMDAEGFNSAMGDAVLTNGAAIQSLRFENGCVYADMNAAFAQAVASLGTTGEYMLIGSVVNTLLDNFGADSVLLTADGAPIVTGNNDYSAAQSFFEDLT